MGGAERSIEDILQLASAQQLQLASELASLLQLAPSAEYGAPPVHRAPEIAEARGLILDLRAPCQMFIPGFRVKKPSGRRERGHAVKHRQDRIALSAAGGVRRAMGCRRA